MPLHPPSQRRGSFFGLAFFVMVVIGLLFSGALTSRAESGSQGQKVFLPQMFVGGTANVSVDNAHILIIGVPKDTPMSWVGAVLSQYFGGQVQDIIPQLGIYRVEFPNGVPDQGTQDVIKSILGARFIEPDLAVNLFETRPNDPRYKDQWAHEKIQSPRAWDVTQGASHVVVAVVDTGVDLSHPDLKDRLTPADTWYDYGEDDGDPSDTYGHGTHVAGIVAATGNNGEGVAGAGWFTSIMPIKVFPDDKGSTSMYTVAKGVVHAVDHHAHIINLSLGGSSESDAMRDAVNYAYDHGVMVVAAAGNNDSDDPSYPAAEAHVLAVAATDTQDKKASFSNYGDWVDIAAPGVSILSTMPTYHVAMNDGGAKQDYDYMSGTSMASPLVAGVAALVKAVHGDWTPDQIAQHLQETSDAIDAQNPDYAGKLGSGRVNAGDALSGSTQPTATPTQQPTATPTRQPTATPTQQPTATPTRQPTATPTQQPTATPTRQPTATPTQQPTATPTRQPTATPTPSPTPENLLPNPSFEMGGGFFGNLPDGWTNHGNGTLWAQGQASDGNFSLAIGPCMMRCDGYWQSDPLTLMTTHRFELSGDLMVSPGMTPGFAFEQWDAYGNFIGELTVPITQTLPFSMWQSLDPIPVGAGSDFPFDPDAYFVALRLYIENGMSGTVWFDNLYLGDLDQPLPNTFSGSR